MKAAQSRFVHVRVGMGAAAWLVAACGGLPPNGGGQDAIDDSGLHDNAEASDDATGDGASGSAADSTGSDGAATSDAPDAASVTTIPLTGCPSLGYAASFAIGGQPFDLIVDTGSGDLAVASNACPTCGDVTPVYTPGASAMDQGRQVTSQYGIGTWTGELFSDQVSLTAAALSTSMKFVAIQSQSQFFPPPPPPPSTPGCEFGTVPFAPQGIAGFGPSTLATPRADVFMSRLVAQGLVPNVFAVELCPVGGQLWIGGFDTQAAATTDVPSYTPMTDSGFYSLTLNDLQLGGQSLGFGAADFGTTIVDTGTTSLALQPAMLAALTQSIAANSVFQTSFQGATGNWLTTNNCYKAVSPLSATELDAMLPGVTLVMPGVAGGTIAIELTATESYLAPSLDGTTTYYCSGVLANTAKMASTILGVAAMSAHLIIFDAGAMRIGFAPQSHCR
jgi:hypothetical protein